MGVVVAAAGPSVSAKRGAAAQRYRTNLVDPASSHMLVSKIKPCMSQYKLLYGKCLVIGMSQLLIPLLVPFEPF